MNALELADTMEKEIVDGFCLGYIGDAVAMLRHQQTEIEKVNSEWVQAAMALGRCVQENHDLKAEIAILRKAQEK